MVFLRFLINCVALLPLWLRASTVILTGILFSVWLTGESARKLDEQYSMQEMRGSVQRSAGLLAGLISASVATRDVSAADATIKQYVSAWKQVTFVHVLDDDAQHFTEWQQHPIKFGDGILKFEAPILFGEKNFGTLSLYVNLQGSLRSIQEHVRASQRRDALTLLGLALLIVATTSYAALHPFLELSKRAAELLTQQGAIGAAESRDDAKRLRSALDLLQRLMERK